METEAIELARVLHGEAVTCFNLPLVFLALAHVYSRNPTFYGYYQGDNINEYAIYMAYLWRFFDDPTDGATFVFSSDDLANSARARAIAQERGPPVLVAACDGDKGAEWMLFFR